MYKATSELLIKKYIKNRQKIKDPKVRKSYGVVEGWVSIIGNCGLFILKFVCGLAINSVSLIADAFHTLSDVITSIVVIVGFQMSQKPGDREHPYGHGRAEYIATLIISLLLVLVGIEFFKTSFERLTRPASVQYNFWVFFMLMFSTFLKEWMYQFAKYLGEKIDSKALIADAWHHRSDAVASLALGLGLLGVLFGFPQIDAILGLIVSGLIIYTGYEIGRDCISKLLGERPSEELLREISSCALQVEGVKDIHDIEVHQYGEIKYISAHVAVDPQISVENAHSIADNVSNTIENKLQAPILVHLDPFQ